ncbi:hypothetical protein [Halostagnicola bangensis]
MTHSIRKSAILAVVLVVLIAGCSGAMPGGDDPGDEEIEQTEILQQVEAVDTYQYEMTQTIETPNGEETVVSEGTINESANRSHVSSTTANQLISENETIDVEEYIIENTMYASIDGDWFEMDLEGDVWEESAQLAAQTDFIESGTLTENGTETVNGVETTVVSVEATDELKEELESSRDFQATGATVEDVSYELYVDEETNYIHGIDADLTMTSGGETITSTTEMIISEHNEPVDIQLPEDAETAEDVEDGEDIGDIEDAQDIEDANGSDGNESA